ncbi:HIT family protein [Tateyamaria sp. SN3-11]|uniref:HIT family protein n=1 Tax=Tateyamaria sp. SN3-11 TaxID=3092147 RepID=UPI0039EB86A0
MCIFCQIIAGEAEASFVHQDKLCVAFMNLRPINPGEFMVIPRAHIDHFTDLSDDLAAHIMLVAQRLGRHMQATLSPRRVGYVVHGFGVPHAHLNVVPLMHSNDIISGKHVQVHDTGFEVTLAGLAAPNRAELDAMAARLRLP